MTADFLQWNVRETPWPMAAECVQTIVTSPPYWSVRDFSVDGQIGLEADPELYVEALVSVFREAARVLRRDGTLWLNIGDTHYTAKGKCWNPGGSTISFHRRLKENGAIPVAGAAPNRMLSRVRARELGLKPGDLVGIPWRLAFALQRDGWIVRSEIIWHKANGLPESVLSRPTRAHDQLFLLQRAPSAYVNMKAIAEPVMPATLADRVDTGRFRPDRGFPGSPSAGNGRLGAGEMRNPRDVWTIATEGYPGHPAVMPTELARRCVLAGSRPGDLVLDPFSGAGTTVLVADRLGRRGIGLDLSADYCALARNRLRDDSPLFAETSP